MITIKKTKAGYHVVITGNNNEVLCTSEVLKTKAAARKNILAMAKCFIGFAGIIFYEQSGIKKDKLMWVIKQNKKPGVKKFFM